MSEENEVWTSAPAKEGNLSSDPGLISSQDSAPPALEKAPDAKPNAPQRSPEPDSRQELHPAPTAALLATGSMPAPTARSGDAYACNDAGTKLIAFYLPQFHPIPENDKAWGKGFTEWTNVSRASALFEDHNQPQLPGELGFYDLRLPEVMEQQADLAKAYGIGGFCYYYYWFDGRRLLEKPLEIMLSNKRVDMPFCLCWANENWSRRWDGSDHEIIVSQTFSSDSWKRFIDDFIPFFEDERYIRINGRPILIIYRPDIIPDLCAAVQEWRDLAKAKGFDLFLVACLTFGFKDPQRYGFDAAVEFPPHGTEAAEVTSKLDWFKPFEGHAYSYADAVAREITKPEPPYKLFRTAMVGWDNTARRGAQGRLYHGATPELFEEWLSALVMRSSRRAPEDRLVFINAWNEWAEGAHLEPDQKFGRQYLAACSRALNAGATRIGDSEVAAQVCEDLAARAAESGRLDSADVDLLLDMLKSRDERLRALQSVNRALSKFYLRWLETSPFDRASSLIRSDRLRGATRTNSLPLTGSIEQPSGKAPHLNRAEPMFVLGWICPARPIDLNKVQCVANLLPADGNRDSSFALLHYGISRKDIADAAPDLPKHAAAHSGFRAHIDLRPLDPGQYTLSVGLLSSDGVSYMPNSIEIFVS